MKKRIIVVGAVAVIVIAAVAIFSSTRGAKATYKVGSEKIAKGSINNTVTATGTLEAITTVEVGTQVSGVIEKIYVDFNTQVKKGQLLARLDETPLQAQVDQSQSNVDNAEAELKYQKSTYERSKALYEKNLIAQSDYDLAEYNFKKAKSSLSNAKSVHDKNKINLSYASIYSPIDGIILDRAVDEGQTVAASFSTPTLFTIANDLTQMQVEANIDEADIGQVQANQRVEFKVDAYPNLTFQGSVSQVRLQPVESSNVITYTVIVNAPNPDQKLMPGMTASITVFVQEKKDILVISGKAVRFSPDQQLVQGYIQSLGKPNSNTTAPAMGNGGFGSMPDAAPMDTETSSEKSKTIWVKDGQMIHPKKVEVGDTDGINYELVSGLNEGEEVVYSLEKQTASEVKATKTNSPFMPQRPGGAKK